MSIFHRQLIEHVEKNLVNVKKIILTNYQGNNLLIDKFNNIVNKIFSFRSAHRNIARKYIQDVVKMANEAKEAADMETYYRLMGNDVTKGKGVGTSDKKEKDTFAMLDSIMEETKKLNLIKLENKSNF